LRRIIVEPSFNGGVSNEDLPTALPAGRIGPAVYTNRVIFGREPIEVRAAGGSLYAGMFGLKEYPASTKPGMLNGLLSASFEFVLSQSFAFLSKADAKTVLTGKQNPLVSTQDVAASQIDDLNDALDDLESNRFVMGDHHLSLLVRVDCPPAFSTAWPKRAASRPRPARSWRAKIWASKPGSGRRCRACSSTAPDRARSPRAISPRCRRSIRTPPEKRTAIIGGHRSRC